MNLSTFESSTEGKYRLSKFPIDSYLGLPPDVQSLEMLMQLKNRCNSSCHHSMKMCEGRTWKTDNMAVDDNGWQWIIFISQTFVCINCHIFILHDPLMNLKLLSWHEDALILFSCSVVQQRLDWGHWLYAGWGPHLRQHGISGAVTLLGNPSCRSKEAVVMW